MNDSFHDRIDQLLNEGKITPEEANRLRKALESSGEPMPQAPLTGASGPVSIPETPPKPAMPPAAPVESLTADKPEPQASVRTNFGVRTAVRKVILQATAGDIRIEGEDGLKGIEMGDAPNLSVTEQDGVVTITSHGRPTSPTELGWLDTVVKAIGRVLPVNIRLRVPRDLAELEIKALAGDVKVRGVKGRVELDLQAGDIGLEDATSFRIHTKAGDVDVKTKLVDGESSIQALAGDVDVVLERESSATLVASVSAGDLRARGFEIAEQDKRMTGGSLKGTLGGGRAKLNIHLSAGDVEIKTKDVML